MSHSAAEDRSEIEQLLYRYARAIDAKDWKSLERVFVPDARIHYAVERGTEVAFAQLGPWLAQAMQIFEATQHVVTNPLIELAGDSASCMSYLVATHVQVRLDGSRVRTTEGSRYSDSLVRTPEGWRISARRLDRIWVDGTYLGPGEVRLFPS